MTPHGCEVVAAGTLRSPMGHGGPVRVVVVDDYGPLRQLLTQALQARGCDVVAEAANGREALDVVERMAADVVVMDLRMPVMDGLAATATMHDRFPEIEIAALTSSDAPGVDGQCSVGARVVTSSSPTSARWSTTSPRDDRPRAPLRGLAAGTVGS